MNTTTCDASTEFDLCSEDDLRASDSLKSAYEHFAGWTSGKYEELMIDSGASLHTSPNSMDDEFNDFVRRYRQEWDVATNDPTEGGFDNPLHTAGGAAAFIEARDPQSGRPYYVDR